MQSALKWFPSKLVQIQTVQMFCAEIILIIFTFIFTFNVNVNITSVKEEELGKISEIGRANIVTSSLRRVQDKSNSSNLYFTVLAL